MGARGRRAPSRRRRARIGSALAVLAVVAMLLVALRYGPPATFALALAAPAVEPWLAFPPSTPPFSEIDVPVEAGRVMLADLYRPSREEGALLLVLFVVIGVPALMFSLGFGRLIGQGLVILGLMCLVGGRTAARTAHYDGDEQVQRRAYMGMGVGLLAMLAGAAVAAIR